MTTKLDNTIKMWEERYNIMKFEEAVTDGETREIRLEVAREDLQGINFVEEWDTMKNLALRQQFYIMPFRIDTPNEISEVLLIQRKGIYNMSNKLKKVNSVIEASYMYMQGNDLVSSLYKKVKEAEESIQIICYEMRAMSTSNPEAAYFKRSVALPSWLNYRDLMSEIKYLNQMVKDDGLLDNSVSVDLENVTMLYNLG